VRDRKNKPIRVRVSGGIGNQVFMYLAGLALSRHLGVGLEVYRPTNDKAKFLHPGDLSEFNITLQSNNKEFEIKSNKFFAKLQRMITRNPKVSNKYFIRCLKYFESSNIGFDSRLFKLNPGTELRGYFQTYRYFELCLEDLSVDKLVNLREPSKSFLSFSEVFSSNRICAIHIRRGDYLLHQETIGLKGFEYYKEAIKKVLELTGVDRFAVFSDSPEVAIDLLKPILPSGTIWPQEFVSLSAGENLMLMSKADSLIIANSSFSLMAGLLAGERSLVIRPSNWFIDQDEPIDLFKPSWIKVDG
jgi:hypothetical protein